MDRVIANGNAFLDAGNSRPRMNRTGATLTQGAVGFIDHPQADADSTTIHECERNVVAVTTARMAQIPQLVVHSSDSTADNKPGQFYDSDGVICQVQVNSTADIAKGDWLKPVNAQVYLVKGTVGTDRVYAQALEARTSDDTGLISVRLFSTGKF